ncbi:MAG: ExbD/TolR family protein [Planctomycetota bacterium]
MSHLRRRFGPRRQGVELTPLVDVSLILVVFMLLNNERSDLKALAVDLPATRSAAAEVDRRALVEVVIDPEGRIAVAGVGLGLEDLGAHVRPEDRVIILADAASRHGQVVAVVDRLRQLGVQSIHYASEEQDDVW